MKRFISWLFWLPVCLVLIAFALANRKPVLVSLDPFTSTEPLFSINLPLWLVLFIGIFVGLVTGWIFAWLGQGRWRQAARKAQSDLSEVKSEKEKLEEQVEKNSLIST